MEPLLARIHQLNALFRQQLFQDITLPDVEAALSRIVSCNICFCLPEGDILHLNPRTGFAPADAAAHAMARDAGLSRYTHALSGPPVNRPVEEPFCLLLPAGQHPEPRYFSFFPAYGDCTYIACLIAWHPDGQMLSQDDAVLCEVASSILGMVFCRARNKNAEWDRIQMAAAQVAVSVLSYSEYSAAREIFRHIRKDECILVVSKLSKEIYVTRSIISGALKKLESSEIIVVRSLGTKGTYIRVINPFIFNALDNETPLMHSHTPAKFTIR